MRRLLHALLVCCALLSGADFASAQEDELLELSLRVVSAEPGTPVIIDRGSADGVAVGDTVRLHPRGASLERGTVVTVLERTAEVRLLDRRFVPEAGTKGEVFVLASRLPDAGRPQVPEVQPPPPEPTRALSVHTTSSGPGTVAIIDRGSEQGLKVGDEVRFPLPGNRNAYGEVTRVGNETAVVEFESESAMPATGASGAALLPLARFGIAPGAEAPAVTGSSSEHPDWSNSDGDWTEGMPLLSQARAVRPRDRPRSLSGFTYLSGQYLGSNDDRSNSFTRLGVRAIAENPFGEGGAIQFDAEFNYRTAISPDSDDEKFQRLRIDRLSYRHGGDRFSKSRWEVGRFLQNGVAEFGVLDGGEFVQRLGNGDRVGVSAGFLAPPLLLVDYSENLQFAGFYEWNTGENDELSLTAGFQKTFFQGDTDRDLLVTKIAYLPGGGWDVRGTAWVDFYQNSDVEKGSGPELSQAWLTTSKAFANGNGMRFSYRHLRTPLFKAQEFVPASAISLANDRYDRLAGDGTLWLGSDTALHLEAGAWDDEDESGGDASVGLEQLELFAKGGRGFLSAFGTQGQFSQVIGGRVSYGRVLPRGGWELFYEFSNQRQDGFSPDRDDIVQHRVRASRDFIIGSRWSFSIFAQGVAWDDTKSLSLAFFLQRSF